MAAISSHPFSTKYNDSRIHGTGEQIVRVSCGAAMLDGRVATSLFYSQVLVPAFAEMNLGANFPFPRQHAFAETFKQIYDKEAMVSEVYFRYFALDELESVVNRALQETGAKMPYSNHKIIALKSAVDWPVQKARLDEELRADCVIRKRRAERDLEECERALKRLKKE